MTASREPAAELKLRPHHIMCEPFLVPEAFDRGEAFNALATRIKNALESESDTLIEVIEGTDDLCGGGPAEAGGTLSNITHPRAQPIRNRNPLQPRRQRRSPVRGLKFFCTQKAEPTRARPG